MFGQDRHIFYPTWIPDGSLHWHTGLPPQVKRATPTCWHPPPAGNAPKRADSWRRWATQCRTPKCCFFFFLLS